MDLLLTSDDLKAEGDLLLMRAPQRSSGLAAARGRKEKPLHLEVLRPLTQIDIDELVATPEGSTKPRILQRLRTQHHSIARMVAQGLSNQEISLVTGYDPARISVFKTDQAFEELVHYYAQQIESKFIEVHERMAQVAMTATEELQERLEDAPEKFTNTQLKSIAKDFSEVAISAKAPKNQGAASGTTMAGAQVKIIFEGTPSQPTIESTIQVIAG